MARTINEVKTFTRADLEAVAMGAAKLEIVGRIYYGVIGDQNVEWRDDGSLVVTTSHTPEDR